MKKIFAIIAIVMCAFVMSCPTYAHDDIYGFGYYKETAFEESDRTDLYSLDLCINASGGYSEFSTDINLGASIGLSVNHLYLGGTITSLKKHEIGDAWGAHVGFNFVIDNKLGHCCTITPCIGVFNYGEDNGVVDCGVVWKFNPNNNRASFVVKTFKESGVSIGVAFNLAK